MYTRLHHIFFFYFFNVNFPFLVNFTLLPIDPFTIAIVVEAPVDFNNTHSGINIQMKKGYADFKTKWEHIDNISAASQIYRVKGLKPCWVYPFDFIGQSISGSNYSLATHTILTLLQRMYALFEGMLI